MKKLTVIITILLLGGLSWAQEIKGPTGVRWTQNSEPDLAGYRLYESSISGTYGTTPLADCPHPCDSYIFPTPHAVGTWYWVVTAYDTSGNESGPSNEATGTFVLVDVTPPDAPTNCEPIP